VGAPPSTGTVIQVPSSPRTSSEEPFRDQENDVPGTGARSRGNAVSFTTNRPRPVPCETPTNPTQCCSGRVGPVVNMVTMLFGRWLPCVSRALDMIVIEYCVFG
jgi:hypothetical protein